MTRHDAARKLLILGLWLVTIIPAMAYMIEADVEAWVFGVFIAVWILIVNVAASALAHWLFPLDRPKNARTKPVGGIWLPSLRVVLWIAAIGGALLFGSMFLGLLHFDTLFTILRPILRFFA